MENKITLENIHTFSIPLEKHPLKETFMGSENKISDEFEDQIIALTSEASKYLWNFKNTQRYLNSISGIEKYFNENSKPLIGQNDSQKVKKWLYDRGIPFDQKVFGITQLEMGLILSWKMLIKFSGEIFFGNDEIIWDKTLNWVLAFHHDDVFYFGRNRNFNAEKHSEEIITVKKIISENSKKASS